MDSNDTGRSFPRREFMKSALAVSGIAAAAGLAAPSRVWGAVQQVKHQPLDPVNPDILYGTTSSIWGGEQDLAFWIKRVAALGLQGIEPYANGIEQYRANPLVLKK